MSNYIEKSDEKEMLCKNRIKELLYKLQEGEISVIYLNMVDNCGEDLRIYRLKSTAEDLEHIEFIGKDTEFIIGDDYVEVIEVKRSPLSGKHKYYKVLPFNQIAMVKYEKIQVVNNDSEKNSEITEDNGSCYIATYVYENYDASEVLILRKFRDEKLLTNSIGTVFVKFYYKVSPFLIKHFGGKIFKKTTKQVLDYIIKKIN